MQSSADLILSLVLVDPYPEEGGSLHRCGIDALTALMGIIALQGRCCYAIGLSD